MPVLSKQFLDDLDIQLDERAYAAFNQHFEETLSERIVESVVELLDEQQVQELVATRDQGDEQLQTWLQTNVPNLKEIIEDEVYILIGELAENSDKI